jgi:hypothetical protein
MDGAIATEVFQRKGDRSANESLNFYTLDLTDSAIPSWEGPGVGLGVCIFTRPSNQSIISAV